MADNTQKKPIKKSEKTEISATANLFSKQLAPDKFGPIALGLVEKLKTRDLSVFEKVIDDMGEQAISVIGCMGQDIRSALKKAGGIKKAPADLKDLISGLGKMLREYGQMSTEPAVCREIAIVLFSIGDRKSVRFLVEHGDEHTASPVMVKSAALVLKNNIQVLKRENDIKSLMALAFYVTEKSKQCSFCKKIGEELGTAPYLAMEALEGMDGKRLEHSKKTMGFIAAHSTDPEIRKKMMVLIGSDKETLGYVSEHSEHEDTRNLALRATFGSEAVRQLSEVLGKKET